MTARPSRRVALLANETGQGRGHVTTLATVARALSGRFDGIAALSRREHAGALTLLCRAVLPAPVLGRRPDAEVLGLPAEPPPDAPAPRWADSWANWIGRRGFRNPDRLARQVRFWQDTIWQTGAALVVADYAPCALLAARALGVPSVVIGNAVGIAPPDMPAFPPLSEVPGGVLLDEGETVALANRALVPLGVPALDRLAQVFEATLQLPRGLALWDPYGPWRRAPLLLPIDRLPPLSTGDGHTVFAYLTVDQLAEPGMAATLATLDLPMKLVVPGLTAAQAAALAAVNPHLSIAAAPLPADEIARTARLIVCQGQAGTAALAVLAGVPMLALPQHNEQACNARGAAATGAHRMLAPAARSAAALSGTLRTMWEDAGLAARARTVAESARAAFPEPAEAVLARALARF
jgi:hypothetical protein